MREILLATGAAFTSTLIASFSGGGSSLIILPILLFYFPGISYISLFTTGKIAATCMTLVSASIHGLRTQIDKRLIATMMMFGLVGTALGTYFLQFKAYEGLFRILLACTLVITAFILINTKQLGIKTRKHNTHIHNTLIKASIASFLINILNGIFGGTGILLSIFCVLVLGLSFIEAISMTIFSYLFINTTQTIYLITSVELHTSLVIGAILGAFIGSYTGTHLQYFKGNASVKKVAISMMLLMSIMLIYKEIA